MVAIDNPGSEMADLMRRVRFLETQSGADGSGFGGGDSSHPGAGGDSILLGTDGLADGYASVAIGFEAKASTITEPDADEAVAVGTAATADGFGAVALGGRSYAQYETSTALGWSADALHLRSTAVGENAVTTQADQIRLGRSGQQVSVPGNLVVNGTFSNPSARRLKQCIIPAPVLSDIFPELTEWEYIDGDGARRLGYIADDLVGTDAERFVTFDDDGRPAGIDYLGLLVVQNAQLLARVTVLENMIEGLTNG
jgi:hypothetical protein